MNSGDISDNAGYQSAAFHDDLQNVNISDDENSESRGYVPPDRYKAFSTPKVSNSAASQPINGNDSSLEELLPESMNRLTFLDVFIPKIGRYIGTNLLQFFYVIAFIAGIFMTVINIFGLIINSFQVHWSLGIISFIYSIIIGLGVFLIYIIALRLLVEFLMSVFVIRERLTRLIAIKEAGH